jgi:hypothetical protein
MSKEGKFTREVLEEFVKEISVHQKPQKGNCVKCNREVTWCVDAYYYGAGLTCVWCLKGLNDEG